MTKTYPEDGPTRTVRRLLFGFLFTIAAFTALPPAVEAQNTVIFGQVQTTFTKDGTPHTVCLGVSGNPAAGAELMAMSCDAPAPVWSVTNWSSTGIFKIAYGPLGDTGAASSSLCLDVDTAHPSSFENAGLYLCHPSTGLNTDWRWSTEGSGVTPDGQIVLNSNNKCLIPDVAGSELKVGPCSGIAGWTLLPAPTLHSVEGTIQHTRSDSTKVCLDTNGPPVAGAKVIGGDCANGDPWHVKTWAPSSPLTRIGYGWVADESGLCLSSPGARPGPGAELYLEACGDVTDEHGLFDWGADVPTTDRPTNVIQLLVANACIIPIQEGEPAVIQVCNDQTQDWTLGPISRMGNPVETVFTSSGIFTATKTTTYRVFAIGGGSGGGFDEGAGGGSGRVSYMEVNLSDGETVTVTVGAGGYGGTSSGNQRTGGNGEATSFGAHLTAAGGDGGGASNADGGNGGSGGGGDPLPVSVDGGAGGSAGGAGGHGSDNQGGSGQGGSFTENLCKILKVDLTPGEGGSTDDRNAVGGGGGGGITVGSETTAALPNAAGTARGGVGYGAGGAGGNGTGPTSSRFGSAGASGLLIVENGGSPPVNCP